MSEMSKMISVFYGENRVAAMKEVRKILGEDCESLEGENLEINDLPNLCLGQSLFAEKRRILIRDGLKKVEVAEAMVKYLNSPHEIIFLETKVDKRASWYKELKDKIKFREFAMPVDVNAKKIFDIYNVAKRDGARAAEMYREIEETTAPMALVGLLAGQAIRDYEARPGAKEKRVLRELSKLDMDLKGKTTLSPSLLVQSFLLRMSSL